MKCGSIPHPGDLGATNVYINPVAESDMKEQKTDGPQLGLNVLLSGSIVDRFIAILNRAVDSDREAMQKLIGSRVPCNMDLSSDPTIQCGGDPCEVGPLGLINGLCGIDATTGYGAIQAVFDNDGTLVRFERCLKASLS